MCQQIGSPIVIALLTVLAFGPPLYDDKIKGWGEVSDPDRDCQIRLDGTTLMIKVPGTAHDLSAEHKRTNAPRVVQEIDGDLIAQVMISGTVHPGGKGTVQGRLPFNGAGLLLWQDSNNYLRLERSAILQGDKVISYVLFESRLKGKPVASPSFTIPDRDMFVRLERRGPRIHASVSIDGNQWQALEPMTVDLPSKLKLGVAAINTATDEFTAQFEHFAVYLRQDRAGSNGP